MNEDTLTMEQFGIELDRVRSEVKQVIRLFYTYLSMHNYAAEDGRIFRIYNAEASYWNTVLYGLQQSMFITLGRIFDNEAEAFAINKLLHEAREHPEFFTRAALRMRRMVGQAVEPGYLPEYLEGVYEPTREELARLSGYLTPHRKEYKETYQEIRSLVIAHAIIRDSKKIEELYSDTVIARIYEMFNALSEVVRVIQNLWLNGSRPDVGDGDIQDEVERIGKETRKALARLLPAE